MRSLAALTLLLVTVGASADGAEEVRRLDLDVTVATWAGDTEWLEKNLSTDYVMITPTGAARSKREIIAELTMPGLKIEPYDPTNVEVRMYGDSAVVTGHILQRFTLGRTSYTNDRRYTNVYVRRKARWILVSGHASTVRR